jgi:hypothetical protein
MTIEIAAYCKSLLIFFGGPLVASGKLRAADINEYHFEDLYRLREAQ